MDRHPGGKSHQAISLQVHTRGTCRRHGELLMASLPLMEWWLHSTCRRLWKLEVGFRKKKKITKPVNPTWHRTARMTQRSQIFWANWATGEEWAGYNTLCTHAPFWSSKSVLNQGRRKWLHCLAGKSCKTAIRVNNSAVKERPVHEGFHWAWFSVCGTAKGKDKLMSPASWKNSGSKQESERARWSET